VALGQKQAQQAASLRARAIAGYVEKIRQRIKENLILPPGLRGNPVAVFVVTQLPDGDILEARLAKPSGNRAYDEAIERAIQKSSPLPRPNDPALFQRELRLTFCPDEERGCS